MWGLVPLIREFHESLRFVAKGVQHVGQSSGGSFFRAVACLRRGKSPILPSRAASKSLQFQKLPPGGFRVLGFGV